MQHPTHASEFRRRAFYAFIGAAAGITLALLALLATYGTDYIATWWSTNPALRALGVLTALAVATTIGLTAATLSITKTTK